MTKNAFAESFNSLSIPLLNENFGVLVTLVTETLESEAFTARRSARFTIGMGAEIPVDIRVETREYLLPVAGCVIAGDTVRPNVGMWVIEGGERWEVFVPDGATQASELSSTESDWITQVRRIKDEHRC